MQPSYFMKAAFLTRGSAVLEIGEIPSPEVTNGHLLLRVRACGVCRTDLHIAAGELPRVRDIIIPGHQIVGEIVAGESVSLRPGMRVGVSWMGGVDDSCWYLPSGNGKFL